ncbi:MAG TPA: molybdenum ABC transporter ATP-binding protein, partial [Cytophagales bacterium]|nr:molybdenum ABC transporter ATP-binding protein [Cytophagales bacterium]
MIRLSLQTTLEGAEGPFTWHVAGDIPSGQLLSVHGPSGAGKTTLLRTLAGLLKPEQGRIQVGETVWYDQRKGIWLPPQKRKIGYLFQDLALFPHLSVIENVRFAMEKSQPKAFAEELLEAVGLTAMAQRKPQTLSGGQQQRVALARALARKPDLLLLDEPLS